MMLALYKVVKFQVKGLTTQSYCGMEGYLCMEDTMEKKDLEIYINVVLKTRSLNGKKYKVKEISH